MKHQGAYLLVLLHAPFEIADDRDFGAQLFSDGRAGGAPRRLRSRMALLLAQSLRAAFGGPSDLRIRWPERYTYNPGRQTRSPGTYTSNYGG